MADEIRPSLPIVPTSPVSPAPEDRRRKKRKPDETTVGSEADKESNEKDDSGNFIDEYV